MAAISLMKSGKYIGVRDLRANLAKVMQSKNAYFVTDHGKPLRAVLNYETLLELLELVDELKDRELVRAVKESREEYAKGGWVSTARLKKKFKA
jgi:PHD/YefM family antitoxin component YafN of YafNO toxin-antitoxin module